jgi:hypothetical protein
MIMYELQNPLNEYFILLSLNSSHIPFMEEIEALLSNYEKQFFTF